MACASASGFVFAGSYFTTTSCFATSAFTISLKPSTLTKAASALGGHPLGHVIPTALRVAVSSFTGFAESTVAVWTVDPVAPDSAASCFGEQPAATRLINSVTAEPRSPCARFIGNISHGIRNSAGEHRLPHHEPVHPGYHPYCILSI